MIVWNVTACIRWLAKGHELIQELLHSIRHSPSFFIIYSYYRQYYNVHKLLHTIIMLHGLLSRAVGADTLSGMSLRLSFRRKQKVFQVWWWTTGPWVWCMCVVCVVQFMRVHVCNVRVHVHMHLLVCMRERRDCDLYPVLLYYEIVHCICVHAWHVRLCVQQ